MTQYEARAYLVLRSMGSARVTELARASGVPRNKLYGALDGLVTQGLAEARGEAPLIYASRPVAEFLRARITRMESLLQVLQESPNVNRSQMIPTMN